MHGNMSAGEKSVANWDRVWLARRVGRFAVSFISMSIVAESTVVTSSIFGHLADGSAVEAYTLKSAEVELRLITYGARVVALLTKDRYGVVADVALGYGLLQPYLENKNAYFGVIAGRFANRIGGGTFELEGETVQTTINDGKNMLHGGVEGFDARNWTARAIADGVEFQLVSRDGDQGFPGALTTQVRYILRGATVRIEYSATTDRMTVVNLTNHTYFNLSGEGAGLILGEELTLEADSFTPVADAGAIPTGEIRAVAGTVFDFTQGAVIGSRIGEDHEQLVFGRGYDHNWVVRGTVGTLRPAAKVYDPASGRVLTVETTEPGIQFYSGNFLDGMLVGKSGVAYAQRSGFCLETQRFPDAPNQPGFPSTVLKVGETYRSVTTWEFMAR
jgi:aldose 1-epimerase